MATSSAGAEGRGAQQLGCAPRALGPWSCLAAVGHTCLEQAVGHRHTPACVPLPVCLQLLVRMGLHKWPAHTHVHALTHMSTHSPMCTYLPVRLLTCVCTHMCIHSHVHVTYTWTRSPMCVFTHMCSHSPLVLVLPGMGLCSSLRTCAHTHGLYSPVCAHTRACIHLCVC